MYFLEKVNIFSLPKFHNFLKTGLFYSQLISKVINFNRKTWVEFTSCNSHNNRQGINSPAHI
jgi:hypothetical protein